MGSITHIVQIESEAGTPAATIQDVIPYLYCTHLARYIYILCIPCRFSNHKSFLKNRLVTGCLPCQKNAFTPTQRSPISSPCEAGRRIQSRACRYVTKLHFSNGRIGINKLGENGYRMVSHTSLSPSLNRAKIETTTP